MKRFLTKILLATLTVMLLCSIATAADADLTYDLSVNGSNSASVKTGDVITVTFTVTNNSADGSYNLNALQNEIDYDDSFFEFVDGSVTIVHDGSNGDLVEKIAGDRVYMNGMLVNYDSEQVVGTFQLKVVGTSGSGKVESTAAKAYKTDNSAYTIEQNDLTVSIEGSSKPDDGDQDNNGQSGTNTDTEKDPQSTLPFTDVRTTSWFYGDVKYVYENGLMNGVSAVQFNPNGTLTRGMIVTILHRMDGVPDYSYTAVFKDVVKGQWYTEAVEWAADNGIVTGYTADTFGPNDPVTREQLTTILYRYASYKNYDVSANSGLTGYADYATVSSYAANGMQWAVAEGLVNGSDGKLLPKSSATRAQVAAIIHRFAKNVAF